MIAPLRHVADPVDLNDGEGSAIFAALQRALQTLRATMQPDGFNAGLNLGLVAGGSIDHLHFHVVPRWDGDTNFMPVIADIKVLPEHLDATAKRLREAYSGLGSV
jgi:ATP adenylyltransferase